MCLALSVRAELEEHMAVVPVSRSPFRQAWTAGSVLFASCGAKAADFPAAGELQSLA